MQKKNMQKICKKYAEYAKAYVLAYFAYICTPHFAAGSTVTVASGDGQLELCARCQSRNEPESLCSDGRVWIAVLLAAWQVRSRSRPGYRDCHYDSGTQATRLRSNIPTQLSSYSAHRHRMSPAETRCGPVIGPDMP